MPRLRQFYSQNYPTSQHISAEFESIIRYLNSAELGNNSLAELMAKVFDAAGDLDIPIAFRFDPVIGLEYLLGSEADGAQWQTVAPAAALQGAPGLDLGTIDAPVWFDRQSVTLDGGNTVITHTLADDIEPLVFDNGILLAKSAYSIDIPNNHITLNAPADGHTITVWSTRKDAYTGFIRSDFVTAPSQVVFPFVHDDGDVLIVFRNGVMQRSGGAFDYVTSPSSDTVTFMVTLGTGDLISIIRVESSALKRVSGLMTTDKFVDPLTGRILFSMLSIADNQIPQAKVADLATTLPSKATIFLSDTTPPNAGAKNIWIDTSTTPNQLKFHNGTEWVRTSPEQLLPDFDTSNARMYVRINATGTGFEYGTLDMSSYIKKSLLGEPNGVASLDSSGTIPVAQIPDFHTAIPLDCFQVGAVSNGNINLGRFYKTNVKLDYISAKLGSGTCTVSLAVNGVTTGSTYNLSSTEINKAISPAIEIDASTVGKKLTLVVTSATSAADLEVALGATALAV